MSREVAPGIFVIEEEPEARCEFCGKVDELRPYGPKGERICFECGMKDEKTTERQFKKCLGVEPQ